MASAPDEHSPPRSDALPRSRRLSTLMDSPSRVTRSQVRRLSSAAGTAGIAEAPMSPKPTVSTRRRSTAAAKSEAALQEEAPAAQEEPDSGKALPRRRSVRKSFADGNEEGPLSSRSSKLSSIDEDSKAHSKEEPKSIAMAESRPVTRRTRASMASAPEPEPDLCLPPRRTRRSSVSSVSSITSSVVASPRTRSRKNLSPVPSPTVSEVSIVSEVPETSPASKTSPRKDSSPMTKKSSTPRQLQLHDSDSTKTRRSSFVVSENIQGEGISSKTDDAESCQPVRRSQGRFSLKSPLKFVETAKEDTVTSNCDAEKKSNNEGDVEVELNKSRSSIGRLSLSSNKSSRLSLSSNKLSPNKLSPSVLDKFESSPHVPLTGSRRSSRSSLSSSKASPAENLKSALHSTESQDKVKWESMSPNVTLHNILNVTEENAGSPRLTLNGSLRESTGRLSRKTSPFKFDVSDRVSPNKCQPATSSSENVLCHDTSQEITSNSSVLPEKNELNNSRRSSTQMVSEGKSPMSNFQEVTLENSSSPDSTVNKVSTEQQVFDVEDSSTDPSLVEVVVEKRNSMGRLSLASNVATPGKVQSPDCPSKVSNIETKGRFSLSSNKSTPAKSPKVDNFEVSNAGSQKTLFSRVSLSSNKSTPAKSPHFDNFEVSNTDSNEKTSLNRFSLSSNKATPSKAEATQDDVSTPNTSGSSEKLSPANSSECDSPRLTNEDAPNTFLSRFSLSFNKSTPAKASPAKSPKCDNTPQLQLNESHRSSIGRLSLSSSKSPHSAGLKPTDEAEHLPDNEESDSVSSTDPSQHDESMGKLNLSGKAEMPSSTKSTERRSLTPSKSLITSHHQEEDARSDENDDDANDESSNDASDNADGDPSNDGDGDASNNADGDASSNASNDSHELLSKIVSLFDSREVSRRASTGNLSMKPLKSDLKTRASMGPLINPLMSYPDDSDDENDSSNLSGDIGDSSNTANDRNQFGKGELTLSPIKPDIPPKKRSLTPSSDKPCNESERQKSPSNPFEKSSVFDNDSFASDSETSEQAVEMSLSSHTPSKLNISINDEKNVSIAVDQLAEAADLESSKRFSKTPAKDVPEEESTSISKVSSHKKQGLAKYYQAAAVLMSGGKISDFDDDDSDDSQLQTVFSPSTMSKREKKLERKARKKAAKEAKKKQKQERMLSLSVADDAKKTDNKENTLQTQNSPYPGNSMKRISMEANLASSEGSNVMVEELDSSGKTSNKRRKTQSQSECDLPLVDYENPSPLKNDEKPTEANIQSAKKLKLKSGSADLKVDIINDHGESETSNTSPVVETACKKKKKKKKAETVTATDMQLNADDTALSKKKKKKLKEKGLVDSAPAAELPLKAKKKKLKKSVLGDEAPVEDLTLKAKKKKLKKSVLGDEALVEDLPLKAIKKKLKKSVLSDETLVEDLTLKAKKKKLKKNVLGDEASVEDLTLKAKKKKLKKSVLGDGAPVEDLSNKKKKKKPKVAPEDHSVEETTTETLTIKKKKKKDLVLQPFSASEDTDISGKQRLPASASTADGSDSDDAPTSVSFAAGKNTALALMQAATLNIKKQEEMKKMKMKKRQEKRREEKSAKRLKLGINIIDEDEDVGGSTSMKGGFPVSSSKIIFDDKGNSQRVKPPKRLPTDLLESLSEQPPTKFIKRPDGSKEKVPADSVSSLEHKKEEMKKARKLARKLEKAKLLQADYVPLEGALGATRFGVVPLRNVMLAKKLQKSKLAEEAANFRKEHLFGNRIHRTPITSAISHEEKRKAAKAGRFMNKKYL